MTAVVANKPITCKELRALRSEHQQIKKTIYTTEKVALTALLVVAACYIPICPEVTFIAGSILSPFSSLVGGGAYLIGEASIHMLNNPFNMKELCRFIFWETIGVRCIEMASQASLYGLLDPIMQSASNSYADFYLHKKIRKLI